MPSVCNSNVALFADDAKCFKIIKSINDCIDLQSDLNSLSEWSRVWKMNFNADKCKILTCSRSRTKTSFIYSIGGSDLEHVGHFKDLGVIVDSSLSFSQHVRTVVGKANSVSYLIRRSIGYNAPPHVSLQLFNTLARSILEYGSTVWSPFQHTLIKKLESVQRAMTRYILHYPDLSYEERCAKLHILPLSYRREVCDLMFLFKCVNNVYDINVTNYIHFSSTNNNTMLRSSKKGTLLKGRKCNRIVKLWNSLPQDVRQSANLRAFKKGVAMYYNSKFLVNFNCNIPCTWTVCSCQSCVCVR